MSCCSLPAERGLSPKSVNIDGSDADLGACPLGWFSWLLCAKVLGEARVVHGVG